MRGRIIEIALLLGAFIVLVAVSLAEHPRGSVSTYSSYDTGPNGYRALYGALGRVGVPVQRMEARLAFLPADTAVVIVTDTENEAKAGAPFASLSGSEIERLKTFSKHRRVLIFANRDSNLARALSKTALRFDPRPYTNAALARDPAAASAVYRAVAFRGPVVFDERVHGFVQDRSFWAALPPAVHAAAWIALAMLVLLIIENNMRMLPAARIEEPAERDSSSYIRSMARMLQRGRAGHAAIARFAEDAMRLRGRTARAALVRPALDELQSLAQEKNPEDAAVLQAARLYAVIRKEV